MPTPLGIFPPNLTQMIDHIVPVCEWLDVPLLCLDQKSYELIKADYPPIDLLVEENEYEGVLEAYDTLVYPSFYRLGPLGFAFEEVIYPKNMRSICTLHGQSDKKREQFWWERVIDEDVVLLYGPRDIEILKEKGIWQRVKNPQLMGNIRAHFYEKYKPFLDAKVPAFMRRKKSLLYAPTWNALNPKIEDRNETSSLFSLTKHLFTNISSGWQLIVKPHPLLGQHFPEVLDELKALTAPCEDIYWLEDFPLVYPLLNSVEAYLGDHSSIGYDMLYFDKPLYFLNHNQKSSPLFACGTPIVQREFDKVWEIVAQGKESKRKEKRALYEHAFAQEVNYDALKKEIWEALCQESPF